MPTRAAAAEVAHSSPPLLIAKAPNSSTRTTTSQLIGLILPVASTELPVGTGPSTRPP